MRRIFRSEDGSLTLIDHGTADDPVGLELEAVHDPFFLRLHVPTGEVERLYFRLKEWLDERPSEADDEE